jgi:transmembrane sensor
MTIDPSLREQAADWAVRTGDPGFADWEGFTAWLEADPAHSLAYDQVMAAVADVAEAGLPVGSAPANDNPPVEPAPLRWARRGWLGGAIAASLAVVTIVGVIGLDGGSTSYATAPGEIRTIALGEGGTITLGGDTRLELRGKQREAVLEQGQALFDLRPDGDRPFEVHAGDDVLRDIGTVFEVERRQDTTSLAVSEGAVLFNPDRQKLRVDPGQRAVHRGGSARIETSAIPKALIGEWREGRQTFRDATLAEVAAALSSASGVQFAVAPGAAGQRISGSVLIEPIRNDPASLGPLLGVTVRPQGNGWMLEP